MEYKNEKLGVRLVVPDKITVRQQLAYISESIATDDSDKAEASWRAACGLITEWECPGFMLTTSLDEVTDPLVTEAIVWAFTTVRNHVSNLENLPKNS